MPLLLRIVLPFGVFLECPGISRVIVQTRDGAFGLLPHRLDCIAALVPGILVFQIAEEPERYVAVDEGILVKTGTQIVISVRNAVAGTDLEMLRAAVTQDFLRRDEDEQRLRAELTRIETGFVSQVIGLRRG